MPMTFKVKVNSPKNDSPSTESKALVEKDIIVNKTDDYNEFSKKASGRGNSKPVILQSITLNNKNLMEAIIYSEILGKPKCKRRGRCR